jgi:FSR family fosmidomycin resistance protein-like MFS transporter
MAVHEANFLRNKSYLAATGSHFFIDVLNNGRIVLAALLAVSLGLTNAGVGLYLLLYNLGTSLSQPLFGWLADRYGARWLVLGGMGWVIFFFGLAAVVPDWPAMIALTVASLGSGAFHPGGTKVASQTSDVRRTQATAFFFTMGQIGLFVGPIRAGIGIDEIRAEVLREADAEDYNNGEFLEYVGRHLDDWLDCLGKLERQEVAAD